MISFIKTPDCLTENNDLCEGYKHIVMTYMREHIHVKPEVLVIVNCVNNNTDLSFFLLNHLRLFLDRRFDVVFDMSSCSHAKKKVRTLEKWGYRVYFYARFRFSRSKKLYLPTFGL